ncbi:MAG: pentapeptide repeat-containing protein, partial [Conchiformibius sp.]|nr:pentapeptide repeat-containing protein [Conchiformibius sp.]
LHSAWQVLQHDILQELDKTDDKGTRDALIQKLHQRADSPLGQAITRVLLACDHNKKPLLHRHLEILPGICLSGMDFNLAGLETEILRDTLFCGQNLTGAQWQGVRGIWNWNLSQVVLNCANLGGVRLYEANLSEAKLNMTNLSDAWLGGVNLNSAQLTLANLNDTELRGANLSSAWLGGANLSNARLGGAKLNSTRLGGAKLLGVKGLTAEQLSVTEILAGSLTDADNFFQYAQFKQRLLRKKGLIVLYHGIDTIPEYLFYKHKTKLWESTYPANSIPFPIDLAATRAANPDWEISIE